MPTNKGVHIGILAIMESSRSIQPEVRTASRGSDLCVLTTSTTPVSVNCY